MAWNDSNNDKNKRPNEGPPDLDEILKKLQAKLAQLLGLKPNKTGSSDTSPNSSSSSGSAGSSSGSGASTGFFKGGNRFGFGFIIAIIAVIYILSGIYIVDPAEEAVIKRFGRYVRTEGAGPHWIPRFIETADIVDVMRVETTTHGGEMLTMDENIVDAKIAVQYRIGNAKDYLFNLTNPDESLKQVSESALRAVVGQSSLNEILTTGRAEITSKIRAQVQSVLDMYHSGLQISDLAMQQTKPPAAVQDAFDDAIKAQQDEERYVNQAQAYARKHIPIAQGHATRIIEEAKAYKEQVVLLAQGEVVRFAKLLPEYRLNPEVMRNRMYLETMQQVYSNTTKVLVDVPGSNNMMYLPLDKMMQQAHPKQSKVSDLDESVPKASPVQSADILKTPNRPSYEDIERLKYTYSEKT